jgi:hypothetical protein
MTRESLEEVVTDSVSGVLAQFQLGNLLTVP